MMLDCDDSDERWIFSEQLIAILTGHTPYKIIHKDLEIIDSESKSGKFGITKRSLTLQSTHRATTATCILCQFNDYCFKNQFFQQINF